MVTPTHYLDGLERTLGMSLTSASISETLVIIWMLVRHLLSTYYCLESWNMGETGQAMNEDSSECSRLTMCPALPWRRYFFALGCISSGLMVAALCTYVVSKRKHSTLWCGTTFRIRLPLLGKVLNLTEPIIRIRYWIRELVMYGHFGVSVLLACGHNCVKNTFYHIRSHLMPWKKNNFETKVMVSRVSRGLWHIARRSLTVSVEYLNYK